MPDLGLAPPLGGGQAGPGLAMAGGLIIGLATVAGARLAGRHAAWRERR